MSDTNLQPILESDKQQVTAIIKHLVKPKYEQAYEQWLQDISSIAQQFEGHRGVTFVRPSDPAHPEYVIILKFDCYQYLQQWLESPERRYWIEQAQPLIQKNENLQVLTGLETWFTLPGKLVQIPPKRYKMASLTVLAVFSVSQFLRFSIGPLFASLHPSLSALILTALTVLLLTYIVMPRLTRLFYRWLYPKHR